MVSSLRHRLYSSVGNTVGVDEYVAYFEIDAADAVVRYIELNAGGRALRYSAAHEADERGCLPEGGWDEAEAAKPEYGTVAAISASIFESVWARTRCDNDSRA